VTALTCVVLAHNDAPQVRRLIAALDPFPVVLHCDSRTTESVYAEMTADLPDRVQLLPRLATGWARWENVAAELAGYQVALDTTDSPHIAVLTGSDYPLESTSTIASYLVDRDGMSITPFRPLPLPKWGRSGGFARLRYPHWVVGKRMLRLPVPRRLPGDLTPAGGSQLKVLSRHHTKRVLEVRRERPDLERFWRRSWIPDETFVASVLCSASLVPDWQEHNIGTNLWFIDWAGGWQKSPRWLTSSDAAAVLAARRKPNDTKLFARKFSSQHSGGLLDAIDQLRLQPA
jgi:hypothetical protein